MGDFAQRALSAEVEKQGQDIARDILHTAMGWHLETDPEDQAHRLADLHKFCQDYKEWLTDTVIAGMGDE